MYVICSEERFVEISSPNECDKILKIPNEQMEPTDYMANCSTDTHRHAGYLICTLYGLEAAKRLRPLVFYEALLTAQG